MCSCASGVLLLDQFSISRVIALDLMKTFNFHLVSHVAAKSIELERRKFTEMLVRMYSCAPGVLLLDQFSISRVIALDLVKIYTFQLVSHVASKPLELEPRNLTGMLVRMFSCASWVLILDQFSIPRVIALYLKFAI